MSGASGAYGFLGVSAPESPYGTAATRTNFVEFTSETLSYVKNTKSAMGIHAGGMVGLASQDQVVSVGGTGDITCYVPTKGFGPILQWALGNHNTTTITGTPNAYQHVFTQAELINNARTVQVGVPRMDGTIVPHTFTGTKASQLKLSMAQSDFLTSQITCDAQNMVTSLSVDTPTYLAGRGAFSFANATATLTIDGSNYTGVTAWDLTIDNQLKTDRYYLGQQGKKAEQIRNNWVGLSGNLSADFLDSTLTAKYLSHASAALEITFTNNQINTVPATETLKVTLPAIKFDGDTPKVNGPDVSTLSIPYRVLDDGTNPPITVTYISTDVTVV